MKSLGFIGATGRLGQELAKGLIKAEGFDSFKAFVRNDSDPDKIQVLKQLGYEIVTVDFDNTESLEENFNDVKTLVSAIGGGPLWRVETVSVRFHCIERAFVELFQDVQRAAKNAGVSLFVPSQFDVDRERFGTKDPFMKAKANVVDTAKDEGLPVLIVNPGYFSDVVFELTGDPFNGENVLVLSDNAAKISFTRRSDVGFVLAKALSDPKYSEGGTLAIQGETMTWNEAVDVLKSALPDTNFELETMTVEQGRSKVEELAEKGKQGDVWSTYKSFSLSLVVEPASGNNGADMSEDANSYGHKMETLEETLKEVYKIPEDED
eukprot:scaffold1170_cov174-Amphora_coffeaeformis.AAC.42